MTVVVAVACSGTDGVTGKSSAAVVPIASDAGPDGADSGSATNTSTATTTSTSSYVNGSFQTTPAGGAGWVIGAGDSSPWLVGTDGNVYHYSNDLAPPRSWVQYTTTGNTFSLAASPEGIPWKIDSSGNVSVLTTQGQWAAVGSGFTAYEIGVGRNDTAWAISRSNCTYDPFYPFRVRDCYVYHWNGSSWLSTGFLARHVAVPPDASTAYVSNFTGSMYKWNGSSFQSWGGGFLALQKGGDNVGIPVIGAADNDYVWVIGQAAGTYGHEIFAYLPRLATWGQVAGDAIGISVSSDGTPWVINSLNQIFEYVSTWQPMGPWGFSFVDSDQVNEIYTGSVQDIAIAPTSLGDGVTMGATYGGVWQTPPTFGWVPIGDQGAGATATAGPVNAISSVAVKPGTADQNTVIVATGYAPAPNRANAPPSGSQLSGNGIWVGTSAGNGIFTWGGPNHTAANLFDSGGNPIYPYNFVKIRYSPDATKIYALTTNRLLLSTDGGASFYQSPDPNCVPAGSDVFTDLVVDPNNSSVVYLGVSGEGVYQGTYNGSPNPGVYCMRGNAPPLYQGAAASTITAVALAMSGSSVLYAAFAGQNLLASNLDFANIDATSTAAWPGVWSTTVSADSVPEGNRFGLQSQGGHDWALSTNTGGDVILLGGVALHRWGGCTASGCATEALVCAPDWNPPSAACPHHNDYHAIAWGVTNPDWVYVANDGGMFLSQDDGQTWQDQINSFDVTLEDSVAVNGGNIFANAWDNGGNFSTDWGVTWRGDVTISGIDGAQAAVDLSPGSSAGFMCHDSKRWLWNDLPAENWAIRC